MTIGNRIKSRRVELGMSQEELATKLGYKHKSSINKIETGVHNLTQSKIAQIAEALNTTPSYIMGWDEEEEEKEEITNQKYSKFIDLLDSLDEEQQDRLYNIMKLFIENQ